MCPPKTPKVEKIPERQPSRLPDNGDPAVREGLKRKRNAMSSMIFTRQAGLGAPSVSGLGVTGG
jgi:hypothetical protein